MPGPEIVKPTTPPWEAAQKLRKKVRLLQDEMEAMASPTTSLRTFNPYYVDSWVDRRELARMALIRVKDAAESRRAGEAKKAIAYLEMHLRNERRWLEDCHSDIDYRIKKYTEGGSQSPSASAKKTLQEIAVLIQSLPTFEAAPQTKAENTIRGIIAILRVHNHPGVEALTQVTEGTANGTPEVPAADTDPDEDEYEDNDTYDEGDGDDDDPDVISF